MLLSRYYILEKYDVVHTLSSDERQCDDILTLLMDDVTSNINFNLLQQNKILIHY